MSVRRGLSLMALSIGATAVLMNCVGDEPTTVGGEPADAGDSGSDGQAPGDSSTPTDSAVPDTGPGCIAPTSSDAGEIDQSFSTGFKSITDGFVAWAMTVDTSGRAYAVGYAGDCVNAGSQFDWAVVRFKNNGDIDTAFNPANKPVCFDFGTGGEVALAVAVDADGKIVIGGLAGTGPSGYYGALVRIDDTGALDTSFNGNGRWTGINPPLADGGPRGYGTDQGFFVNVNGIGITPDNKIVVVGADDNNPAARTAGFVVRLNHDGSLDNGFATGGVYKDATNVGGFWKVAIGADGSIGAVGGSGNQIQANFIVEKFTSAGVLDSSFGGGGIVGLGPLAGASTDSARSIVLMPNGDYAVFGAADLNGVDGTPAIAMIKPNGTLDTGFNGTGIFLAPAPLRFGSSTLDNPAVLLCDGSLFYTARLDQSDGGLLHDIGLMHVAGGTGALDMSFGQSGVGRAGQTTIANVVSVAIDPVSHHPVVMASNLSNQVGVFRFLP